MSLLKFIQKNGKEAHSEMLGRQPEMLNKGISILMAELTIQKM